MAKVMDYYIGATHIECYDDYVVTDPKRLAQIKENLDNWATRVWTESARRKQREAAEKAEQEKKNNSDNKENKNEQ